MSTRTPIADDVSLSDHGRTAALRSPQFRLLMAAGMAMQVGQWIQRVALLWVVYEITGSALSLGGLASVSGIAILLISPFVGLLVDRFGARRVLMSTAIGQGLAASLLALAVFTGHTTLLMLYAVGMTFGIGQALNMPTRNLLVYNTVGRDLLRNGLALNSLTGNTMRVIGPTVGGIIVGLWGAAPAFALQAILLVGAVALVKAIKVDTRRATEQKRAWTEFRDGIKHIRENPMLQHSLIMAMLYSTFVIPYLGFMPAFVKDNIQGGAGEQGILLSAVGVGSIAGSWYIASGRGGMRLMLWAGAIYMALVTAFVFATNFWFGVSVLIAAGLAHAIFSTLNQSLIQLNAGEEYRARVMGVYSMSASVEPLSVLLMGGLAASYGPSIGVGSFTAAATVVALVLAITVTLEAGQIARSGSPS